MLLCNMCHQPISAAEVVFSTICQHLYCARCADAHFQSQGKCKCGRTLTEDDVLRVDLKLPEKRLKLLMAGMSPDTIMACSRYALSFWEYQVQVRQHALETKLTNQERHVSEAQDAMKRCQQDISLRDDRIRTLETRLRAAESRAKGGGGGSKGDDKNAAQLKAQLAEARRTVASFMNGARGQVANTTPSTDTTERLGFTGPQGVYAHTPGKSGGGGGGGGVDDPAQPPGLEGANPFLTPPTTEAMARGGVDVDAETFRLDPLEAPVWG